MITKIWNLTSKTSRFAGLVVFIIYLCHGTTWAAEVRVTLVFSNQVISPTMVYAFIARDLGYWKSEGLNVEFQFSKGSAFTLQLLASRKADIGQSNEIQLMLARHKGLHLKSVMTLKREFGSQLGVLVNSPINTIDQLKGKNIGVAHLSAAQVPFTKAMLTTGGLDPIQDARIVAIGWGAQALAALLKDRVAAVSYWNEQFLAWEIAGHNFRYFPADFFPNDVPGYNFVAHEDFIQNREDILVGLLRGIAKGIEFSFTNPEAAVKIYYKANPTKKPVGGGATERMKEDVDFVKGVLKFWSIQDRKIKKWGANYRPGWEAVRDFYLKQGVLKEKRDVEEYYISPRITDRINDFDSEAIVKAAQDYK